MSLEVGARLGHYTVTAKLGEGGMGEVWEATDTTLNRQVAVKIQPEGSTADSNRLMRFDMRTPQASTVPVIVRNPSTHGDENTGRQTCHVRANRD